MQRSPDYRKSRTVLLPAAVLAVLAGLALSAPGGSPPAPVQQPIADGQTSIENRIVEPGEAAFSGSPSTPARTARRYLVADSAPLLPGSTAASDLDRISNVETQTGTAVRFQQTIDGTPVMGAEAAVALDDRGNVVAGRSETLVGDVPPAEPLVTRDEAIAAATSTVSGATDGSLEATGPELVWFDARLYGAPGLERPVLVWKLELTSPDDPAVRRLVLVDARSGAITFDLDLITHALDRSVCDASNVDGGGDNYPCTPTSSGLVREEGDPPVGLSDANKAYDYSGDTYDYFLDEFNRDSIDDMGMPLFSTVRYCEVSPGVDCSSTTYPNAFWNGSQMTYGDGYASDLMVVAHELTHGVTENTSNLFYYFQSGAINEALSDIFGKAVQLTEGPAPSPSLRWRVGSDLPGPLNGVGIRDMEDPTLFDDPDRITSGNYVLDQSLIDSGGVHSNSGVANRFFSLLVDGGTFNGKSVSGLGLDKASRIVYQANTAYMTSGSDYADFADSLDAACGDLTGQFSISSADCAQVSNAISAVEMRVDPIIAPAPEAPKACNAGQADYTTEFSSGFEADDGKWTSSALEGADTWYEGPSGGSESSFYSHGGAHHAYGGFSSPTGITDSALSMSQAVSLPSGKSYLRFAHAYDFTTSAYTNRAFHAGVVEYSIDGGTWRDTGELFSDNGYDGVVFLGSGNPLADRHAFVGQSHGYRSSRADLSTLAGDSVRFRFRAATDTYAPVLGWAIDDVRIYSCSGKPSLRNPGSGRSKQMTLSGKAPNAAQVQIRRGTGNGAKVIKTVSGAKLRQGVKVQAPVRGKNYFWARVMGSVADSNWSERVVYRRR